MSVQLPANAGPPRRPLIPAHDRLGLSRVEAAEYNLKLPRFGGRGWA
jgi:hypothetical protein